MMTELKVNKDADGCTPGLRFNVGTSGLLMSTHLGILLLSSVLVFMFMYICRNDITT